MTDQIGVPVRIAALVGVVAALGMATWTLALGRGHGSSAAEHSTAPASALSRDPAAAAHAVRSKVDVHDRATAAATHRASHARAAAPTRPAHRTAPARARHPHAQTRAHRTASRPVTIAALLRRHKVVVVLLYDPQSKVDSYSVGEAALGAASAGAGFLRVDVLDRRRSEPFAKAYRALQTPTLLFVTRRGKLVQKLTGFADHETVAQAATNAARGLVAVGR